MVEASRRLTSSLSTKQIGVHGLYFEKVPPFGGTFISFFGLIGVVRGRINGVSGDGAASAFAEQFPTYQWSVNSKSWQTAAVMVGVYSASITNRKWNAHTALTAGLAKAWLPEIILTGIQDSSAQGGDANMIQVSNRKANATTFTAMIKLGVSYALTKKLSLTAGLDFWYLKPKFTVVQAVAFAQHLIIPGVYNLANGSSVSYNQVTGQYSQSMNSLNLAVGVSMKL